MIKRYAKQLCGLHVQSDTISSFLVLSWLLNQHVKFFISDEQTLPKNGKKQEIRAGPTFATRLREYIFSRNLALPP